MGKVFAKKFTKILLTEPFRPRNDASIIKFGERVSQAVGHPSNFGESFEAP
jgi:hypothetical protein